jgi:hypothetical protein
MLTFTDYRSTGNSSAGSWSGGNGLERRVPRTWPMSRSMSGAYIVSSDCCMSLTSRETLFRALWKRENNWKSGEVGAQ